MDFTSSPQYRMILELWRQQTREKPYFHIGGKNHYSKVREMPSGSIKTAQEAEDFVLGCTFMGTGGGGDPAIGLKFLLEDLKEGREIRWVDMS